MKINSYKKIGLVCAVAFILVVSIFASVNVIAQSGKLTVTPSNIVLQDDLNAALANATKTQSLPWDNITDTAPIGPYSFMISTFTNATAKYYQVTNGTDGKILDSWTSTDAYVPINQTIRALPNGGIIKVGAGNYSFSITMTDQGSQNIIFEGMGKATVFKTAGAFNTSDYDIFSINAKGWVLKDFYVDGDSLYCVQGGTVNIGVLLNTGSSDCVIDNVIVENAPDGLYDMGNGNTIRNCYVGAVYNDGIVLSGTNGASVHDNIVNFTQGRGFRNGIALVTCVAALICDNQIFNAYQHGIALENLGSGPCVNCRVENNIIQKTQLYDGLIIYVQSGSVDSAKQCRFTGNTINGTARYGMLASSGSDNVFSGNTVTNTTNFGIYVNNAAVTSTKFERNTIFNSGGTYSIYADAGTGVEFLGNTVTSIVDNKNIVGLRGSLKSFKFNDNSLYITATKGSNGIYITDTCTNGTVSNNNLYGGAKSGSIGIWINSNSTTDVSLVNNFITGYPVGIQESWGDYNTIIACNTRSCTSNGILTVGTNTHTSQSWNMTAWIT